MTFDDAEPAATVGAAPGGQARMLQQRGDARAATGTAGDLAEDTASDLCTVVARELASITAALQRLQTIPWSRYPEARLLDAAAEVEATLRCGFGVQMRVAGEVDSRGVKDAHGARSAASLLAGRLRITAGEAKGRVTAARMGLPGSSLTGERVDAPLPQLTIDIDEGSISGNHVRVITDGMAKIPAEVDSNTRAMCAQLLTREARLRDPIGLRKVAEQVRLICDEDGTCPKPDPVDVSEFHFGALRADGLTSVRGLLDPLTTEQLRVAIEDLARPRPIDADIPDPRPAPLRRAQALSEVIRRYLALGATSGDEVRPTTGSPTDAGSTSGTGPAPADSGSPPRGKDFASGEGQRSTGSGTLLHSRARPQIGITIRACDLDPHARRTCESHADPAGIRVGVFDYGSPVSLASARMLACDGDLIPQLLGADGVVLDQGRAVRIFTRAQRRALITRDKGCSFPGCDIPANWCEAHHITYWSRGGPTDLANGVLLCRRHHVVVHQEQWRIEPAHPNGRTRPWFIPPKHLDPDRKPRRNSHFHLPESLGVVRRT